jgi:prophage DNA circulation protein
MRRSDADEAAVLVDTILENLIGFVPAKGRAGSDARATINDTRVNAKKLLIADMLGPPFNECFDLALTAGTTLQQFGALYAFIVAQPVTLLGAALVRDAAIRLTLAMEGRAIAAMDFVSRQDVAQVKAAIQQPFQDAEEIAADSMDQMTFQALIGLHGAITNHLVETARPLPRMLGYHFNEPLPSLVMAYKLYGDASRADEMRDENKIVHPAFCPIDGQALSS